MSHWTGSRPLGSATLPMLAHIGTPLEYPVLAPCHGDTAALGLQILPILQQITDGVDVCDILLAPSRARFCAAEVTIPDLTFENLTHLLIFI